MGSFNRVILMGNLTRDPETRFSQGGSAIVKFGLAVNEKYKGSDGEMREHVTFVDVTMFGKRGEAFAKFHSKGGQALIEGRLRLDQWEDKQSGQKRSKLFVIADSFEFVGGKQERGGSAPAAESFGGGGGDSSWMSGGSTQGFDDSPF